MKKVLFLDFDGVLFDTLREVYVVNRAIYNNISLFDEIDETNYKLYYKYKYLVYNIFMFLYFNPLIFENLEEEKIVENYQKALENRDIEKEKAFCNEFLNIRKDLVENHYDFWQKLEVPYDFFYKIKELSEKIDIVIASKKNKESIIKRFLSYDFYLDENKIFAREALDKYQTKADFLAQYMEKEGYEEALFIDDNSNNLTPCQKYPQIKTLLASWGNIAPEDKGVCQEDAVDKIKKFFNL